MGYKYDIYLVGDKKMEYLATTPSQLSKILRARRGSLDLTQLEVADLVGLLPKTVSALENRAESSSIETLFKCLSALDLEMRLLPKEMPEEAAEKPEW